MVVAICYMQSTMMLFCVGTSRSLAALSILFFLKARVSHCSPSQFIIIYVEGTVESGLACMDICYSTCHRWSGKIDWVWPLRNTVKPCYSDHSEWGGCFTELHTSMPSSTHFNWNFNFTFVYLNCHVYRYRYTWLSWPLLWKTKT